MVNAGCGKAQRDGIRQHGHAKGFLDATYGISPGSALRVRGDGIEDDLAGTLDQVEAGFHPPFEGLTKPGCCSAVRSLRLDVATSEIKVPSDQGPFRPIDVITPKA